MNCQALAPFLEQNARQPIYHQHQHQHRDKIVTRGQLLDEVWGYASSPITRTIDNHIAKLRQKIEDIPSDPQHIITVHRLGYRFVA